MMKIKTLNIISLFNLRSNKFQCGKQIFAMLVFSQTFNLLFSQIRTIKLEKTNIEKYFTLIDKNYVDFSQINLCKACAINNKIADSIYGKIYFVLNSSSEKNAKEFSNNLIKYNPVNTPFLNYFKSLNINVTQSFVLWMDTTAKRLTVKYYDKNNYKDVVNSFFFAPLVNGKKTIIPSAGLIISAAQEDGNDVVINEYGNKYYPFKDTLVNEELMYIKLGKVAGFDEAYCRYAYNYLKRIDFTKLKFIRCGNSQNTYYEICLIHYPRTQDTGGLIIDFQYFLRTVTNKKEKIVPLIFERGNRFKYEFPEGFAELKNDSLIVMNYNLNRNEKLDSQPLFTQYVFTHNKKISQWIIPPREMKKIVEYCPYNYDVIYKDKRYTFIEYAPIIIDSTGTVVELDYLIDLFKNKEEWQVPKIKNVSLINGKYIVDFVIGYGFYKLVYNDNLKLENIYSGNTFPYYYLSPKSSTGMCYAYVNDDFYQFIYKVINP